MRKNDTARRGNAIRARGRHHLWTCAPSNQKIHDMSMLCQYFAICMDITRHIKRVFGWCPLRPSPWPRHALIRPASPIGKSTRGGNKVCACVKICHPLQQVDRKTTRPRKQCHLTCAGPLHGKVHCAAKKQKDWLKLGGELPTPTVVSPDTRKAQNFRVHMLDQCNRTCCAEMEQKTVAFHQ